jgi:hypothetical protein
MSQPMFYPDGLDYKLGNRSVSRPIILLSRTDDLQHSLSAYIHNFRTLLFTNINSVLAARWPAWIGFARIALYRIRIWASNSGSSPVVGGTGSASERYSSKQQENFSSIISHYSRPVHTANCKIKLTEWTFCSFIFQNQQCYGLEFQNCRPQSLRPIRDQELPFEFPDRDVEQIQFLLCWEKSKDHKMFD